MWPNFHGISLANKCLLLFGGAVVLIVFIALTMPWLRMNSLVDQGQLELSRQLAATWERLDAGAGSSSGGEAVEYAGIEARRLSLVQAEELGEADRFVRRALKRLAGDPDLLDHSSARWLGSGREYRYAKAVRDPESEELAGVILLTRRSAGAAWLLAVNGTYLFSAGSFVLALAVVVFYFITHRLVLSPVQGLKETAEVVRAGNLDVRSEISTGDEFEELAETFNLMLGALQERTEQLHANNAALDMKLNELAEANVALFETAKLKGEFLANVSHELRTPLNSIIGFGELLQDIAGSEENVSKDPKFAKRVRYIENIVSASRDLLEMINGLLEMAKIERAR